MNTNDQFEEEIVTNELKPNIESALGITPADRLLAAIDFEVGLTERRNKRPGWTPWAVSGSLGVLFWTLLSLFEKQVPSYESLAAVVLVVFLLSDAAKVLTYILSQASNSGSGTLQVVGLIVRPVRQLMFLSLSRAFLIIYLAWSIHSFAPHAFFPLLVNYGVVFIALATGILLSFTNLVAPNLVGGRLRWGYKLIELVGLALILFALIPYAKAAISSNFMTPDNIRIAVLIVVGVFLLERISFPVHPPLEKSLVHLRRNLALGKIDVTSAAGQLDIIVTGLKVSHVLQREVSELLASLDASIAESQLSAREFQALQIQLSQYRDIETDRNQNQIAVAAILASALSHGDGALKTLEKSQEIYRKVLSRVDVWRWIDPSITSDVDLLKGKMDSSWTNALEAAKLARKNAGEVDWEGTIAGIRTTSKASLKRIEEGT